MAVSAEASNDELNLNYTRDVETVATFLQSIRDGEEAYGHVRFEPLDSTDPREPSEFARFSVQCPLWRIEAMPHSDIRQPVFVTWDCTDYRIHDSARIRDLRQASFWFENQKIRLVKFGTPKVVSINPR